MEYIKKIDFLNKAVEVEYLGRPRLMVSVAKIGQMPSIEAVPMEYHNKVCEELARRNIRSVMTLKTKTVKYYDEDENVWKVGEVIVDE
jgi:hypothetical protein